MCSAVWNVHDTETHPKPSVSEGSVLAVAEWNSQGADLPAETEQLLRHSSCSLPKINSVGKGHLSPCSKGPSQPACLSPRFRPSHADLEIAKFAVHCIRWFRQDRTSDGNWPEHPMAADAWGPISALTQTTVTLLGEQFKNDKPFPVTRPGVMPSERLCTPRPAIATHHTNAFWLRQGDKFSGLVCLPCCWGSHSKQKPCRRDPAKKQKREW